MTWTDGASYEGQWLEGFANGKGKFNHHYGDQYDGNWKNNKCHGYGTYTNKKGALYQGNWNNDQQEGHGDEAKENWSNPNRRTRKIFPNRWGQNAT